MKEQVKKWIKENSMIVLLLGLFFLVPYALRLVDETAAAFDAGILHSIVLVCVAFSIFQLCTWSIIKVIWKDIGKYFMSDFPLDFALLDGRTKLLVALGVYFFILLQFILLTCAIL